MRGVEIVETPAKSILNRVTGMPFRWSINPYRGCYHGCVFCYARKSHAFLEQDGVERWSNRVFVKSNAPAVLRSELARRSWKHETVAIGTVTDPYQPLEGRYRLTRGILEALRDYDTPAAVITRSPLIVRMDPALAREIEPTVAPPAKRLFAVRELARAGIPVRVALAPVLPQITDTPQNLEAVVRAAREAGASKIWHSTLRLHEVTRDAFFGYLRAKRPELIAQYANDYRGTYAPRAVHARIDELFAGAMRRAPQPPNYPVLQPKHAAQLSLL